MPSKKESLKLMESEITTEAIRTLIDRHEEEYEDIYHECCGEYRRNGSFNKRRIPDKQRGEQ